MANPLQKGQVIAVLTSARAGAARHAKCRAQLFRPRVVPAVAVAAIVLVAVLLGACVRQTVRPAPFRQRPDSIEAGDLRGPFRGKVVDAATGDPVAGALVYATWSFQSGYGLSRPAGYRELVSSTDADGVYSIAPVEDFPADGSSHLTDFYLVVYKRGYVAYRSDRRFADLGPRRDFAQVNHRIHLERWRATYSHAHHLRYIGGGAAIAALTAWEIDEATAELDNPTGADGAVPVDLQPAGPSVIAAQLLREADIKAITGFDGSFETGPLGDEPDTATYSSQHLKALGLPETYDVALRVWRLPPDAAQERYVLLRDSLPGVEQRNELATQSFRATEGNIYGIGFLDAQRGAVALLTCGTSQCASLEMASALAVGVYQRLATVLPETVTPGETP